MDKYKVNYIYNDEGNIDDIFIKVLNKELKKYTEMNFNCEKIWDIVIGGIIIG